MHYTFILILFFILGYAGIVFETFLRLNKAATALLMATGCWLIYFYAFRGDHRLAEVMNGPIADIAQIIFFLMAVMAIVELIDSHHGFKLITDLIYTSSKKKMLWFVLIISFFMSSVLDNLTSMIVMISLLRKMVPEKEDRWFLGAVVVVAVNAGGAWTPIGDVTTTMLWISNRITTWQTIKMLFFPSVVCAVVTGLLASFFVKGKQEPSQEMRMQEMEPGARRVFFGGVIALIMIPVWKALFHLPPFMGALLGLGVLWLVTDLIHFRHKDTRCHLRVPHILGKIDTSGILFFLGILLAISSLGTAGILKNFATFLENALPNQNYVAVAIGLISSVVDNVPLVAATFGMYDLATFPQDSIFWQLIAYAAGTGGSILIIGSAAGVAFMGLENVNFFWYLKRISWMALVSYFAGIGVYFLQKLI